MRASFNRKRAEGALPLRRNASRTSIARKRAIDETLAGGEARLHAASLALETALIGALRRAFDTRKQEEGLSYARLGKRCGRLKSAARFALLGRDCRLSTLSDFAEALDLRLEFAFVDSKQPHRRFTPGGIEFVQIDPAEAGLTG